MGSFVSNSSSFWKPRHIDKLDVTLKLMPMLTNYNIICDGKKVEWVYQTKNNKWRRYHGGADSAAADDE